MATQDTTPAETSASTLDVPPPRRGRFGYPLIIALIVGVGVLLVVKSSFSSGTYSLQLADVVEDQAKYMGHDVKLVGKIKEGSVDVVATSGVQETRFTLHDGQGHELRIVYPHNPPDPFKEGRDAIVEGTLQPEGHVLCTKLTVKCPSKYQTEDGAPDVKDPGYYQKKYGTPPADTPAAAPVGGPTS